MAKKLKIKRRPSKNLTELTNMQLEFKRVKEQKKLLEKRENELKAKLDEYLTTLPKDRQGHRTFTTVDENGERIHLMKQARRKVQLNPERAMGMLRKRGFNDVIVEKEVIAAEVTDDQILDVLEKAAPEYLDIAEVVDEDALQTLIENGDITLDEFEKMCDIDESYAITFVSDKKYQEAQAQQEQEE